MEEKDSEISGPCEEFRIYFCGEVFSGSVAWYFIDVSEKTESSTKKLNPFSVSEHFPSVYYAFLKGCIYSLGGQRSDKTLLDHVSILDIKSLDSFAARGEQKPKDVGKLKDLQRYFPTKENKGLTSGAMWENFFWMPSSLPQRQLTKEVKDRKPGTKEGKDRKLVKKMVPEELVGIDDLQGHEEFVGIDDLPGHPGCIPPPPLIKGDKDWKPDSGSGKIGKTDCVLPWIDGRPMTFARRDPHTMVADQKLYVLGGFEPNQNQADGWIEVFDPVVGKWESLPSPPDQIHSSVMISGLLKAKKEIIIAKQRWDHDPMIFYSYNIMTRCWKELEPHKSDSKASVHLPPNAGRAVTVGNTLYWISTEEHNRECIIRAYDLDRNMWFEDHLNPATIVGRREHFSSIYSCGPGFLHLRDQKFCLLLQSSITKNDPPSSIEYLYCVILDISPIYEHEDRGKFELTTVSVQKYTMDRFIDFLDCMLGVE